MKKNLDEAKGIWTEYLHEIIWSYHITPHSTTKKTLFRMVYDDDAMIHIEVNSPTYYRVNFDNRFNKEGLNKLTDLIEEMRRMPHIMEYAVKQRMDMRFNTRAHSKKF